MWVEKYNSKKLTFWVNLATYYIIDDIAKMFDIAFKRAIILRGGIQAIYILKMTLGSAIYFLKIEFKIVKCRMSS